jgi:hypothetical protein
MKTIALFLNLLFLWTLTAPAQSLQQRVTLNYSKKRLESALYDISKNYNVSFTYSSNFIPVDQKVSVTVKNELLSTALDLMLVQTGVVYKEIGSQVVLKMGTPPQQSKQEGLSQINTLPKKIKQTSPIYPLTPQEQYMTDLMKKERGQQMTTIEKTQIPQLRGGDSVWEASIEDYKLPPLQMEPEEEDGGFRLAQVSILPFVGTNLLKSNELINNFSLNLFWGTNGGVDGVEVGGFVNTIKYEVKGLQIAGLGNIVGGDIVGTQAAGLFNAGNGHVQGVQAAGLFNLSGGDLTGIQAAGLFNISNGKADGMQLAGLFNTARGKTKTQIAGLFNVAKDVEMGQVSALLNVGKKVSGFQIALINVADSTSGVPIGLLNIIKKGYNRLELASGEALLANLGFKFGAHSFYNIFQFGARWDDVLVSNAGTEPATTNRLTWALGYGIGTTVGFGKRTLLNLELISLHVNEQEEWTDALNQLTQFRLLFDVRVGQRTSLFAGPVGNVLVSRLTREGTIGSNIMPYTQFDETIGDTNVKMWTGFNAGIRF